MTKLIHAMLLLVAVPCYAFASEIAGHQDPIAHSVLGIAIILVAAKIGGELASRIGQPAVLGELICGVLMGNVQYLGFDGLTFITADPSINMLASLGVLILLFEVGLESTVGQMMKVGASSFAVATLGVVAPMTLGWGAGALLLPQSTWHVHAFLGATLCATSVGITARVLQDIGRSQSKEARIILGAAVIDDVLGLIVLAVVSGVILAAEQGGALSMGSVAWIVLKAAAFLFGSLAVGAILSPKLFRMASRLRARGVLLALGLSFCFFLAWLSQRIGLAPIVGAFAAGLILEELHYRDFVDRGEHPLEHLVHPISSFLVPIFFVVMGMRTDLRAFKQVDVLLIALVLTVAAIIGKQACSAGVIGSGIDRLSVGIGMIPRGEVGLIFANIGLALTAAGQPVISPSLYSAIVIMVIVTTLVTPPALKWSMARRR